MTLRDSDHAMSGSEYWSVVTVTVAATFEKRPPSLPKRLRTSMIWPGAPLVARRPAGANSRLAFA